MKKTIDEIARIIGGTVLGDGSIEISGITNIEDASENDITFAVPPHLEKAVRCQAGAVILPDSVDSFAKPAIRVPNPRVAFATLLEAFNPPPAVTPGIHPTAVVSATARLGANVTVMPFAVIADDVVIGDNTILYPYTFIGEGAILGSHVLVYPHATIREHCQIGSKVVIHSGAVIGSDGFGFVTMAGRHHKVPQVGNVIIEDDVEVGANMAIDRATTGSTVVKRGTKIDNLVHLAHNVVIGEDCFLVAQTGISGSVKVGNSVTFAGQVGSAGHLTIGENSVFAARSGIIGNVPPNSFYAGFPAQPHAQWLRTEAAIRRIPELIKKVRELEKRLGEAEIKKQ